MSLEDDILIEKFLREELSEKERQSFMERLSSDPNFRAHFLMEKQLFDSLNEESWSFVKATENGEIEAYESIFKSAETHACAEGYHTGAETGRSRHVLHGGDRPGLRAPFAPIKIPPARLFCRRRTNGL